MAEIGLLRHLLFLLLCVWGILCGSINMKGSGEYSVLGSEFTFTCEVVNASVPGLITFTRRDNLSFRRVCRVVVDTGRQITRNNSFLCSDEDGQRHTYTLTIRDVSRDDSTDWLCQGGVMRSNTVTLDVRYPPTVAIHAIKPCSGLTFLVDESKVSLSCTVKGGNPAPTTFTWHHGDVVLKSGADQIYTLDRVTRSSQGKYRCTADNGISPPGQANVAVTVHYPPIVHMDGTRRVVNESDDLTIHCAAEANPEVTSIVWTKKGVGGFISANGTLHIKNIRKTDGGVYVCKATNTVTPCRGKPQKKGSSLALSLEVQSKPNIPSSLKATSTRQRSITLQWEKAFNGGATQSFNIQYREPGGQWTTHPTRPSEDEAPQLDIDGLKPGTLYQIRMNALNEYGSSSYTSITVTTDTATTSCVPVYVVVIACVASVLLTAAVYTVVLCTKAKCQSQTLTSAEAEGDNKTTREDENKRKDLYTSLTPVQDAYENINIDNQPRPSTSTPAASTESPSSDPYYSVIKDTTL
ncbi:kin of IRRE-like protein 3 [Haliotis cracherodii]|uniref:kin of IRRE-like protein 3 n=1 Tax=Haliotis cracherodii TaxID=6455 RepID=UPI0039E8943D